MELRTWLAANTALALSSRWYVIIRGLYLKLWDFKEVIMKSLG